MKATVRLLMVIAALSAGACGSDDDEATTTNPSSSTTVSAVVTTAASPTTAEATSTTKAASKAASAVVGPNSVGGVALGASKAEAIAALGTPTQTGQESDISGAKYDFLRWQLGGNKGLTLNFRSPSVTSPRLTDWIANAPGPVTAKDVKVGDGAAEVTAAYGALEPFCCETHAATVEAGGGRLIVVVDDATQMVVNLTGGDPEFWSRSIAS